MGAYDATIDDGATAVAHACREAAHKAKCADRCTYETEWLETAQFILDVVENKWVQ